MGKIIVGGLIVVAIIAFALMRKDTPPVPADDTMPATAIPEEVIPSDGMMEGTMPPEEVMPGAEVTEGTMPGMGEMATVPDKEFVTTAFYDDKGAWFSLKEMKVKQGDHVRIRVTNTKGMHDFVLDEYNIQQELPLNQEVVIDFIADERGTSTYYCSKPGHRARGQEGKLIVE